MAVSALKMILFEFHGVRLLGHLGDQCATKREVTCSRKRRWKKRVNKMRLAAKERWL